MKTPVPVNLDFLHNNPLLNRARATEVLRREGLSAVVVGRPANISYLTNHWPLLERMGATGSAYAVLSADSKAPVALVMGQFSYYYGLAEEQLPKTVQPFLVTGQGQNGAAAPARMFRVVDERRCCRANVRAAQRPKRPSLFRRTRSAPCAGRCSRWRFVAGLSVSMATSPRLLC